MPFFMPEELNLKYFTFESFPSNDMIHAVFTRHGGTSPVPWSSLNLGGTTGDSRENVIENRRRIFSYIQRPVESIFDSWQVHGNEVICVDVPRPLDSEHQKGDAILTNKRDITLLMRFADCVPVLLYDPVRKVVGIVHAGWQGTVKKIAAAAVEKMVSHYGSAVGDIYAGIGPSIGPDHYEVGQDVLKRVHNAFVEKPDDVIIRKNGRITLDLWKANETVLKNCGVEKIEIAGICTACHVDDWYSHRAEKGKTGRFAALIALH